MNIIERLINDKIADNAFHASNMLNVLHCQNLKTDDERIARCELYKAWKMTGENKKIARENAIAGKQPPAELSFTDTVGDAPKEYVIGEGGLG